MTVDEIVDACQIENQVCTLEQAKKLKEILGDEAPESLWTWNVLRKDNRAFLDQTGKYQPGIKVYFSAYPAYTGDEIADILIKGLKEGWIKKEDLK